MTDPPADPPGGPSARPGPGPAGAVTVWSVCPGCGVRLPDASGAAAGRRNATSACWQLYGELIGYEFLHLAELGRLHQLMVDTYAAQHAGPESPPLGVAFALIGLRLALDEGMSGLQVRAAHQYLGVRFRDWPVFDRPAVTGQLNVADVLLADSPGERAELIGRWAAAVWSAWSPARARVAALIAERLPPEVRRDLLAVG